MGELGWGWVCRGRGKVVDEVGEYGGEWGRRGRGRESGEEKERESKREDFENVMGCISGTSWNWNARLVPS